MDVLRSLYGQFDPVWPLEVEETDWYENWQEEKALAPDDIKKLRARGITRPEIPVCRMFTDHRGVGKATELKPVKHMLKRARLDGRCLSSLLDAGHSLDSQDATPDIIFHMIRQLVDGLNDAGLGLGRAKFDQFFGEIEDLLNSEGEFQTSYGLINKVVQLCRVSESKAAFSDDPRLWNVLLRNLMAPPYEDEPGTIWYDWNALLAAVPGVAR